MSDYNSYIELRVCHDAQNNITTIQKYTKLHPDHPSIDMQSYDNYYVIFLVLR